MNIVVRVTSFCLALLGALMFSCENEIEPEKADLTQLIKIEGFDKWTSVVTGTYEYDTSYYLIIANQMTNTAMVSQHIHIAIKKSVLRQKTFPISVDPADFSILHIRYIDEPSPIKTSYNVDESLTIDNINDQQVYGSFSAFDPYGNQISGSLLGLPFNWHCPVGGRLQCTFDAGQFNTTMFSWTGGGDFEQSLDPKTFRSVVGIFTLPVDLSTLENNFILLENNQVRVKGRFEVSFFRVDFFPEQPLKPGSSYTAKILTGLKNTYDNKTFAEEKSQEFQMICTGSPLTSKLFNTSTTLEIGLDLDLNQPGTWSVRQGSGGTFGNVNSSHTNFTGQEGQVYTLRWSPSDGSCSHMTVDMRPVVSDFEGNMYHEVKIGEQTWMGENLKSTFDANGQAIPNSDGFGKTLYRWDAAMKGEPASPKDPSGVQGICPNGWHLPSAKEFEEMLSVVAKDGRPVYDLLTKGTCQKTIDLYGFGVDNCGVEDYWSTTAGATNGTVVGLMIRGEGYSNIVDFGDFENGIFSLGVRCVKN